MYLWDFQIDAVQAFFDYFKDKPVGKMVIKSPTGTGKTVILLRILKEVLKMTPNVKYAIVTARVTIIEGFLKNLGYEETYLESLSNAMLKQLAAKHHIYTYETYRNLLISNKVEIPSLLLVDECHHFIEGNILTDQILYHSDRMRVLGLTATDYRGTPKQTKEYRDFWGYFYTAITEKEALAQGYWRKPLIRTEGVIDDDVLKISGTKFAVASMKTISDVSGDTYLETIKNIIRKEIVLAHNQRHPKPPIIVEVPGTDVAKTTTEYLNTVGIPAVLVTHKTKDKERRKALKLLKEGLAVLVEISILGEGFDLPDLAVVIDAKPKRSPVEWMQLFGRLTRRSDIPRKIYYCLCRNVERFAYLLQGVIPPTEVAQCQEVFGAPSKRAGERVFGTEKLGRFKAIPFQATSGVWGSFYLVSSFNQSTSISTQYAVLLLPDRKTPVFCAKENFFENIDTKQPWKFGKWKKIEPPEEFTGFKTVNTKNKHLTPKQEAYWEGHARSYGLIPHKGVAPREFQILPILSNVGIRL